MCRPSYSVAVENSSPQLTSNNRARANTYPIGYPSPSVSLGRTSGIKRYRPDFSAALPPTCVTVEGFTARSGTVLATVQQPVNVVR